MNDRNVHTDADPRVEQLIDGITPGDPLSDLVEERLNLSGPVPVSDEVVDRSVNRALARIQGQQQAAPASRRGWWMAFGVALAAALALFLVQGQPASVETTAEPPPLSLNEQPGLEIRAGSDVQLHEDVVWLGQGVVSVHHDTPDSGPHSVRLTGLDVLVDPVGTVYFAGSRGDVAAIRVTEGRVRLTSQGQGHLGEIAEGGWAILVKKPDTDGIALHRVEDGPFDASSLGIGEADLGPLLAEMRWMSLPLETRTAILGGDDLE